MHRESAGSSSSLQKRVLLGALLFAQHYKLSLRISRSIRVRLAFAFGAPGIYSRRPKSIRGFVVGLLFVNGSPPPQEQLRNCAGYTRQIYARISSGAISKKAAKLVAESPPPPPPVRSPESSQLFANFKAPTGNRRVRREDPLIRDNCAKLLKLPHILEVPPKLLLYPRGGGEALLAFIFERIKGVYIP